MFTLQDLYIDYKNQETQNLIDLLNKELKKFLVNDYVKEKSIIDKAISITKNYTNNHNKDLNAKRNSKNEVIRNSGEPYINHTLRVALILVHERLFDSDVLIASIMHDLFEDTEYTEKQACIDFGKNVCSLIKCVTNASTTIKDNEEFISPEEYDYVGIINNCNDNKMGYMIKFADRLDNLETIDSMPSAKQIKKIEDTKKFLCPLLTRFKANRFLSYINDAMFKAEQALREDGNDEYLTISKRIKNNCMFESVSKTFTKIKKVLCLESHLIQEVRLLKPTIYEISQLLKEKELNIYNFSQSNIRYKLYLIVEDGEPIPRIDQIITTCYNSGEFEDFSIERFFDNEFVLIDNIRNHYGVRILSSNEYNALQYGDDNSDLIFTSPIEIEDDLSNNIITVYTPKAEAIYLPAGSSVVDFAFKIHKHVGEFMVGAKVNNKNVSTFATQLKTGDIVEIIEGGHDTSMVQPSWFLYCKTKNAKTKICNILKAEKANYINEINNYEKILNNK